MQYPEPAQTVKDLVVAAGKAAARPVSWREGLRPGKGRSGFKRMHSRFVTLRVRPAGRGIRRATGGPELPERWLLAEWPAGESEPAQFWLSSLPFGMPWATLVRLAKLRWRIEHDYCEMKQALDWPTSKAAPVRPPALGPGPGSSQRRLPAGDLLLHRLLPRRDHPWASRSASRAADGPSRDAS